MKKVYFTLYPKFTSKAHTVLQYHIWTKKDGTVEGTTERTLKAMEDYGKICFENARKGTENTIDYWKSYGAIYENWEECLQSMNKENE